MVIGVTDMLENGVGGCLAYPNNTRKASSTFLTG